MGSVTLVGAGCGRELITVKGLNAVKSADVIVYDDLIDVNLLNFAKENCEIIYVGKRHGHHSEKQENINKILIEKAKENKNVVRLKGGDSFVFGRGGEEIIALQTENIPYDIVAGVTSAVAVPESLGIPVTHRGAAQSFTVVTGHTATETNENYQALAALNGTLVFLMGLHNISDICQRLINNGKDKNTPASILSKGYDREQKRIDGTLENIADKAHLAQTPAIFVVGSVAALDLRKTRTMPLDDISVTVTGTTEFSMRLSKELSATGAFVVSRPNLRIIPKTDKIPEYFNDYTYVVFTSSNGINVFFDFLKRKSIDYRKISHLKFACIGEGTKRQLGKFGFNADFVPSEYTACNLGRELPKVLNKNDKLLVLRAENGSEELTAEFRKAMVDFDDIKIYDTVSAGKPTACDTYYITFASSSGVAAFFENGGELNNSKAVCIGEITARAFEKYSDVKPLIAKKHTSKGIISVITEDRNEKV